MDGNEIFTYNNNSLGFTWLDFWKFQYSNIDNLKESIAEFLVAKALGIDTPHNTSYWTLFDILYRNTRIEVKQTAYYHPWNENGNVSNARIFDIKKANSSYENEKSPNIYERQNDIYVFCLNNGNTKETSNPLELSNWEFYIIPTSVINEQCQNNKTVSLGRIRSMGFSHFEFGQIKAEIDRIIDELHK